ncbi:MAG: ABC transporter substrate-binding protein [Rhodospirillales bacterium]|nr:ABC transporter substrate-binding protein [Rhodospirillales bacterium]
MSRTLPAMPRRVLLGAGLAFAATSARAAEPFRIGVLADMSGAYADVGGLGSVEAARMAVEDFGGSVLGRKIEVVSADHLNKTDVGVAIAREWLGPGHVNLILDMGNSAIALALQGLVRDADRVAIPISAVTSDLTGKACSPNSIHWAQDNWSNGVALMRALRKAGKQTFYFVTVDYSFGLSLEADARAEIVRSGGKVLGAVRHPLNTTDFSSYLLQAQASGADVVVFASAGTDTVTAIEQAHEFGLTPKQVLTAPSFYLATAHAIGLEKAQGLLVMQSWYWDSSAETRAWAQRFFARRKRMPNDVHAAGYSAVGHYLRAVARTGTEAGRTVIAAMRAAPVDDVFTHDGHIREDNKMVFTRDLMRVKTPAESHGEWDLLDLVTTIPPDQAFRPVSEGGCPLVKA